MFQLSREKDQVVRDQKGILRLSCKDVPDGETYLNIDPYFVNPKEMRGETKVSRMTDLVGKKTGSRLVRDVLGILD